MNWNHESFVFASDFQEVFVIFVLFRVEEQGDLLGQSWSQIAIFLVLYAKFFLFWWQNLHPPGLGRDIHDVDNLLDFFVGLKATEVHNAGRGF